MPATTKDKTWDRYVPEPLSRTMSLAMGSTPQPSRGSQTPNTTRPPPSYFTTSMGNPAAPIYPEPLAKGDVIWMERSHLRLLLGFLVGLVALCVTLFVIIAVRDPSPAHCASVNMSRLVLPHHFSLSILSPFTSVVEHEVSTFNGKLVLSVMMAVCAAACGWYYRVQH